MADKKEVFCKDCMNLYTEFFVVWCKIPKQTWYSPSEPSAPQTKNSCNDCPDFSRKPTTKLGPRDN